MRSHRSIARRVASLGAVAILAAVTACRSATEPASSVHELEIGPTFLPCDGSPAEQCLAVRERTDAPYGAFYGTIAGFTFEYGYHYVLLVRETRVVNPPADGSSREYRLIRVLRRDFAGVFHAF